jgi:hypothetical protein
MSDKHIGYSITPLAKKLGLKPGAKLVLMNEPQDYFDKLEQSPSSFDLLEVNNNDKADFIHVFSHSSDQLTEQLSLVVPVLERDGILWISWPKGIKTYNREHVREIGLAAGLVDTKVAAFDEQWSGLKFVYRLKDR